MYLDLLYLTIVVCFVVDISGIVDSIKYLLWTTLYKKQGRWDDIRLKPFDCSLCSTWWSGIVYLLVTHSFTLLGLAYLSFLCLMTPVVSLGLVWFREVFNFILVKITPR